MESKPVFYDNFRCKADKCTDTCCAGWEIDIDPASLNKYRSVAGEFSNRLNDGIVTIDGQECFRLDENERCCFLEKNGLCAVYSNLGKDFLCEICKEHPRFYDEFDSVTEKGAGLCCERVCELLIECGNSDIIEYDYSFEDCAEDISVLLKIREECFEIIKDTEFAFEERIRHLLDYSCVAQYECFGDKANDFYFDNIKDAVSFVVENYRNTEPINENWSCRIKHLAEFADCYDFNTDYIPDLFVYEKLLIYIIYRHFMKCRFDGRLAAVIRFAVCALIYTYIFESFVFNTNGFVTDVDRINIIKLWSQQIEYSGENTDFCLTIVE